MKNNVVLVIVFLLFTCAGISLDAANVPGSGDVFVVHDTIPDTTLHQENQIVTDVAPDKNFRKEKLIASILAFPVPFGFCGLHRIYMGSEPWVPVAYLITGGGGFGILPLIDFIFIVTADEEEFKSYKDNPHLFMWVK